MKLENIEKAVELGNTLKKNTKIKSDLESILLEKKKGSEIRVELRSGGSDVHNIELDSIESLIEKKIKSLEKENKDIEKEIEGLN